MSKLVIVHHAHYPDEGEEGIYRLIFAEQIEHVSALQRNNPEYNPDDDDEGSRPFLVESSTSQEFINHEEIIWCAGDPKWQGRSAEDIAAEQLQIVKDSITQRVSKAERAEAAPEQSRRSDFETVGVEL